MSAINHIWHSNNPPTYASGSGGSGAAASTASALGTMNSNAMYQRDRSIVILATVRRTENGFVLQTSDYYGATQKEFNCTTVKDVCDLLATQIVVNRLEEK
jgi:hypothetical protein